MANDQQEVYAQWAEKQRLMGRTEHQIECARYDKMIATDYWPKDNHNGS